MTSKAPTSDLDGWLPSPFTAAGITHTCYEKGGGGPGVVLLPELPGISPEVLGLAQHLVDNGFTVVIPSLFGVPGKAGTLLRTAVVGLRVCISREFRAFACNAHRPVADYLRALAHDLNTRTPGPGVGVIGLCFTGGFALAAALDDSVLATVMSQPSVPVALGASRRTDAGVSDAELQAVADRHHGTDHCVLGLRFSEDSMAPEERFATLYERLGEAFEHIPLNSGRNNTDGFGKRAHAVLTHELRETPGHPALEAREQVVAFLQSRLGTGTP
ncbi:dienelactone hydrolase family protein [Streptomyces europaeiscabiei]|uniref:dienelactone hydrolase family protein n=1 Tax=Streptomyces europaeiscabiei TaxID=146819 RepID=UPI0029B046AA|nr:dienelactone hydrolase family protein [Streptomyces europaeiscabiei]MDX3712266.1 dienelactone hydrolase family protein [Streptomyces europaeiscabiei]MDX3866386.1 dienelactone hydrolase family protein [Streptomyces europaeiscabiei]MDX3876113.1 dienelactone hydrolase family protein [Streptomyces europaeiscabiei]